MNRRLKSCFKTPHRDDLRRAAVVALITTIASLVVPAAAPAAGHLGSGCAAAVSPPRTH